MHQLSSFAMVFLPTMMSVLSDTDENLKRNTTFCYGVCAEGLKEVVTPSTYYPQVMHALSLLFGMDVAVENGSSASCVDNAAAVMSHMIMVSPNDVPLATVLPVIIKSLPLNNDMTDNETVYKCLLELMEMNNTNAVNNKLNIQRVFQEAVKNNSSLEEV